MHKCENLKRKLNYFIRLICITGKLEKVNKGLILYPDSGFLGMYSGMRLSDGHFARIPHGIV